MTLEEAKEILHGCSAYFGDGFNPDAIVIDGEMTKKEIQALWVIVDALGMDWSEKDDK